MAELAGPLVSTLLARVRDPSGLATSRTLARSLLSEAQRFINLAIDDVIDTASVTVEPEKMVYSLSGLAPNSGRLLGARDADGKELPFVGWDTLRMLSRTWFRDVGDELQVCAPLGRDLLLVYPAVRVAQIITVYSAKLTAPLVDDSTATEMMDDALPAALDLAEIMVNVRQRAFAAAADSVQRMAGRIAAQKAGR